MNFTKPEVEFIEIKTTDVVVASECTDISNSKMASGEDCINAASPSDNCELNGKFAF